MAHYFRHGWTVGAAVGLLILAAPALALIERDYSLKEVMEASKVILEGKIVSVTPAEKKFTIEIKRALKGESPWKKINVNLTGGQEWYPDVMIKHIKQDAPVVLFYDMSGTNVQCEAHTDGLWFQIFANQAGDLDNIWWRFTHIELNLRKTYDGPTPELMGIVEKVLAGKAEPPPLNAKLPRWSRSMLTSDMKARELGIDPVKLRIFHRMMPMPHAGGEARGVAWADVDGDGNLDAVICSSNQVRLYRNTGSSFEDITASSGIKTQARCASFADYNRDGKPDLLVSPSHARPTLWTNLGGGKFADSSKLIPEAEGWNPEGTGWIDANGDGLADMLITNGEYGIALFLNTGASPAAFAPASGEWGVGKQGLGVGNGHFLTLADYDGDGLVDFLYTLNGPVVGHNLDGRTFVAPPKPLFSYNQDSKIGVAWGDFDNDGSIDLFVPQAGGKPRLYHNNNDGTFTDVIDKAGEELAAVRNARSAAWGDLNNDGLLDLAVAVTNGPLRIYINKGDGTFDDHTDFSGTEDFDAARNATGLAFADVNRDGKLDLLITGESTRSAVLINERIADPKDRAPLRIMLPPSCVPGAMVRVLDGKDRLLAMRPIGLVQNFSAQEPNETLVFVPPGTVKITVLLTDGSTQRTTLKVASNSAVWSVPAGK